MCRFSKNFEREIRAISLNEWQTPDSTLMRRRRKGFLRSLLIIMEEFFSSQVAQLINGKNPRESWHFWPKMDLFSERIFMTVNLLKLNVRESKNSCWWKTSVFRSGRYWFFTGQMDSSFPNHRKFSNFCCSHYCQINVNF